MDKLIIITTLLLLSACANVTKTIEKPLLYETKIKDGYTTLAQCVFDKLHSDSRRFMRLLYYQYKHYPEINTAEIYAYNIRFLPGIFASNSPTNPDAVLDYVNPNPIISPAPPTPTYPDLPYTFVLTIKDIDDSEVYAAIRGDQYIGTIVWKFLQACKTN